MSHPLPAYDELVVNETLGARCAWGVFGTHDQLGTINLLTAATVLAASREIQTGKVFNVCLPLNIPDPPLGNRGVYRHHVSRPDRNSQDDLLDNFYLQGSTQWDGLRHVGAREFGFYNGTSPLDAGPAGDKLGIQHWAEHGIVGRGVLLDVAGHLARQGLVLDQHQEFVVTAALLADVAAAEGVSFELGDILLIRTGFVAAYLRAEPAERLQFRMQRACVGLDAGESMAAFLWDNHFAALAVDNNAVESYPGDPRVGYLHRRLIPLLGFALGEWFNFEDLAEDADGDRRYTCFFASMPLNLPGGVGSPANAVALK
jgi:kynurenine formamidase